MKAAWLGLGLVLALAGCVDAPMESGMVPADEVLPPGYPPQIGTVTASLNGAAQSWDTYDYSVGSLDAAVQIMGFNGLQFRLMGDPKGQPNSDVNRLLIKAAMKSPTQTGALTDVVIEIVAGKAFDGPRLTSVGSAATLVLDSLTPMAAGSYGHVTGHFTATMCGATGEPPMLNRTACQPFEGIFSSDLQISGP